MRIHPLIRKLQANLILTTQRTSTNNHRDNTSLETHPESNEADSSSKKSKKWLKDLNFWITNADTLTNKIEEFECRIRNAKPHFAYVSEVLPKNFDNPIYKEFFATITI